MLRRQGRYLDPNELDRIISLLRESELTLPEIATRMSCSRSTIIAVNRRFRVREYKGLRARWVMNYVGAAQQEQSGAPENTNATTVPTRVQIPNSTAETRSSKTAAM
jgi:hypothetical protein